MTFMADIPQVSIKMNPRFREVWKSFRVLAAANERSIGEYLGLVLAGHVRDNAKVLVALGERNRSKEPPRPRPKRRVA